MIDGRYSIHEVKQSGGLECAGKLWGQCDDLGVIISTRLHMKTRYPDSPLDRYQSVVVVVSIRGSARYRGVCCIFLRRA